MPFDGGEFSQSAGPLAPEPLPLAAAPAESRTWRTWVRLRALLPAGPGRHERRSLDAAVGLLRAARAMIEVEGNWVAGAYRTSEGRHCAIGALRAAARGSRREYGRRVRQEAHALLLAVARDSGFDSVEKMNDKFTHAQVLAAFDAAIVAGAWSAQPTAAG